VDAPAKRTLMIAGVRFMFDKDQDNETTDKTTALQRLDAPGPRSWAGWTAFQRLWSELDWPIWMKLTLGLTDRGWIALKHTHFRACNEVGFEFALEHKFKNMQRTGCAF